MSLVSLTEQRSGLLRQLSRVHWPLIVFLSLIALTGVLTLYSVADENWSPWSLTHALRYGVALVILLAIAVIPLRYWLGLSYPLYAIALLLLIAVAISGDIHMGAKRWVSFGPLSFQPSELMKITLAMALARYYHGLDLKHVSNIIFITPPLVMIALPVLLVFAQPDLGTAILLAVTGLSIIILAGISWRLVILGTIIAGLGFIAAIRFDVLKPYQLNRLSAFLNPGADPLGQGYHLTQSKIALGSGGVTGKGFGDGTQSQLDFLPEMQTDFIFTIIGEEFGLIGALMLLGLYLTVFLIGTNIATRTKSHFGRLLTMGICVTFLLYVLINTGMVMGLAPVVGVPLPLVSYGGTVMMAIMVGFGLVMSSWICKDHDTLITNSRW